MHYSYRSYNDNMSEVPYLFIGILMIFAVVTMSFKAISHDLEKVTQTVEIVSKQDQKKMEREYDLAYLFEKRGAKNPFEDYTKVLFKLTTNCYDRVAVIYGDKEFIKTQKCIQYKKMILYRDTKHKKDSIESANWNNSEKDLDMLNEIKCK